MPSTRTTRTRRNPTSDKRCTVIKCMRKIVFMLVFLLIGLSTGLIGPSILYLEKLASSREDETALIFTSKSVGCIGGWIVSCLLLDSNGFINKPIDLLSIGLFGLIISNGLIIFIKHLWWMLAVFFLQGLFVTISLQGCVYHHENIKHRLHVIPQYLTTIFLLGCVLTPYLLLIIEPNLDAITPITSVHPSSGSSSSSGNSGGSTGPLNKLSFPIHDTLISNISNVNSIQLIDSNNDIDNKLSTFARYPRQIPMSNHSLLQKNNSNYSLQMTTTIPIDVNHHSISSNNNNQSLFNVTLTTELNFNNKTQLNMTLNASSTTTTTTTTTPTTIKPVIKKKPSVNDAKHLNQDSSAADGSETAFKMKKLTEERQIEKLTDEHKSPPSVSNVDSNKLENVIVQNQSTTTTTPTTATTTTTNTTNTTTSTILMHISNSTFTNQSNILTNISNSTSSPSTDLSFHLNNVSTEFPPNLKITTSIEQHHPFSNKTTMNPMNSTDNNPVLNTSKSKINNIKVILGMYNITDDMELVSSNNNKSSTMTTTTTTTTTNTTTPFLVNTFTPTVIQSNNIIVVNNSTMQNSNDRLQPHRHHHRIAEHSSSKSPYNFLLPFQYPMESVQKVYLLLSIIALIVWLLTIPLTSWCESMFMRFFDLQLINDDDDDDDDYDVDYRNNQFELISVHKLSSSNMKSRLNLDSSQNHSEEGVKSRLLEKSDESDTQSDSSDELWNRNQYIDKTSEEIICHSDSELMHDADGNVIPENSLMKSSVSGNNNDDNLDKSVSGLEITFSGFIASLTIRYLLWSPTLAIIVTSLFWFGNLAGYVIRLLIINAKWPDLRDTLPDNSNNQLLSFKRMYSTRKHRRSYSKNTKSSSSIIIITSIQLCGSFVCIVSAIALTRLSMSTGKCSLSPVNTYSLAHPYITWLIGSFCFGIGIGLSSPNTGTLMTIHSRTSFLFLSTTNSYQLQLVVYFGQLLMPAIIAMLHHQALLFWHYSCVHSLGVLCVSVLMCFTLIGHFANELFIEKKHNYLFKLPKTTSKIISRKEGSK
ncbi:unnamed protein product [Schistosoma turkestanicum]|nr:unnamed protein product [Schistosoma turkestanicum]